MYRTNTLTNPMHLLATSALLALAVLPLDTHAAPSISAAPAIAGSGCPGNATYRLSTLRNSALLTVRTPSYVAQGDNVSCNMALPISVPRGYRIEQISGAYHGYIKGKAHLQRSYFLAGGVSPTLKTSLVSSRGKSYSQQDTPVKLNGACGENVNVRVQSRLRTQGSDSLAKVSGMTFYIRYSKCR